MTSNLRSVIGIVVFAVMLFALFPAQAQSPGETLTQYVADLQKNSNDSALREKIIKLAQTMTPAPSVPEEARRHYVIAMTLLKDAKKVEDFGEAVGELKSALLIAPWWPEANLRLGMTLESAEKYDEAMGALKLCLVTGPAGETARAVQDEIYIIEAKQKKAAKESSPEAATQEQKKSVDWLKKLDGRRYTMPFSDGTMVIDVRGKVLVKGVIDVVDYGGVYKELTGEDARIEILSHETIIRLHPSRLNFTAEETYIISEDGDKITERVRYTDGDVREFIFLWQR